MQTGKKVYFLEVYNKKVIKMFADNDKSCIFDPEKGLSLLTKQFRKQKLYV